ncbi:MAG: MutS-related protein [Arcticibacter sp.]
MKFVIDRETYNDLEIFSSPESSLFSILNHTKTSGGERLLKSTMQEVLNDLVEIEQRRDLFQFFCVGNIELEVEKYQMENIDFYLSQFSRSCLKDNAIDAFYDHWSYKFTPSQDYYQITTGVKDIIRLLKSLNDFGAKVRNEINGDLIMKDGHELERLLADKVVARNLYSDKDIGFRDLSYLDNLFRAREKLLLKQIVQWVYRIDMATALSKLVKEKGWCLADYLRDSESVLSGEGMFHPCINRAVSNDFTVGSQSNVTFLTGPNMAGKSSFLKTIGISVYLAHLGFPVPATRFSTPVFNGLVTTINLPDNIHEGLSHFYSEAQRIRNTAMKLSDPGKLFVIFDELFRGTNLKDAFEATIQLITSLAKIKHSTFLVSSHLVDIIPDLAGVEGVVLKCFDCSFTDGRPVFSYKIKDGASNERLGMYILRNEGIFEILEGAVGEKMMN